MENNSLAKNYILNFSYQVLILFIPFFTTPYISRVIGAEGVGIYSFTSSLTTYFILFACNGTTILGQREIAYSRENLIRCSENFFNIFLFRLACAIICFFVFLISFRNHALSKILLIQSLSIIGVATDISWLFQGMERFQDLLIKNAVVKIIGVVLIFILVKTPDDLIIYILINVGTVILGNLSMWNKARKIILLKKEIKISPLKNYRLILSLFIPQIAIQVYTVLDKTMIGIITGSVLENGYYEQAYKIISISLSLVTAFGTVMVPRIANTFAKNNIKQLQEYMYLSYRFVWLLSVPVVFGIWGVGNMFISWFLGDGYEAVPALLRVMSLLIISIGINNVTGIQYLMTTKQQKKFTKSVIIGAVVNFLLNLFLIRRAGAMGAAIASVVAETTIAIIQIICVKDFFSWKQILYSSKSYFASGLIMYIIIVIVIEKLNMGLIFTIFLGFFTYFVCLLLLKDTIILMFLNRVKNSIMRKKD